MSSNWGKNLNISIFGESHGKGIGVVIDGVPGGIPIDMDNISKMMIRRAPGRNKYSTQRLEQDQIEILSGIYEDHTTGTPIGGMIINTDTRSTDYKDMPLRPSHGDYTGRLRYSGYGDPRGGGHFSGRLTAPLVFAGAIAKEALRSFGVYVGGYIHSVYTVTDEYSEDRCITAEILQRLSAKEFPVFDDRIGDKMKEAIEAARLESDSLGGTIGCYALGLPAGIGSPMFDGIENKISSIVFGIPAVRGIEFGSGFDATTLKGSQHNDPFVLDENGKIVTETNHHGGVIGGISTGMPIYLKVGFKPTPSIGRAQITVDFNTGEETILTIKGRHDPCIVPRAVPCVEAAVAIALLDALLEGGNPNGTWEIKRKA